MFPLDFFLRLPPAAALLVLSSIIPPTAGHVLPRQTKTLAHRTLDVLPWPLATPAPTATSGLHADNVDDPNPLLLARQLNTVCGYIGGDPDLPATCSAGSHCAVDVEHSAVGCCPDGVACTAGVYTGCVDGGSDPQTEIDPYVFTCRGGDSCYQNQFDGGYFQYGCGSETGMGATVAASATGLEELDLTELSITMTASKTSLSEPTTLGTRTSTESEESSSTTEESSTSEPTSTDEPELAAPNNDDGGYSNNVGPIVGGTVGGLAFVVALVTLGLYLWRRKQGNVRQGPGQNSDSQYISPMSDTRHPFEPLPSVQEVDESQLPQDPPRAQGSSNISSESYHHPDEPEPEPVSAVSPWSSGSSGVVFPTAVGGSGPQELDQMPLTSEGPKSGANYNAGGAYGRLSDDSREDNGPADSGYGAYPGPRRGGGGGALWQQTRNMNWM